MKVVFKYRSDKTGKTVTEETFLEHIPQPRVGDMVLAEGRPRQVRSRRFHVLGDEASGNWDIDDAHEPYVEIHLIG